MNLKKEFFISFIQGRFQLSCDLQHFRSKSHFFPGKIVLCGTLRKKIMFPGGSKFFDIFSDQVEDSFRGLKIQFLEFVDEI